MSVVACCVFAALIYKLVQIRDSLGMANEMLRTITIFLLVSCPMFAIHLAMQRGATPIDTHVSLPTVIMAFYFILETFCISR